MRRILTTLLAAAAVTTGCQREPIAANGTSTNTLPAFDISVLRSFETNNYEAFVHNPMQDELKVGYALALSGFWLVKRDLKTSEAFNKFAADKARKHGMKNEEAQAVMGSAMLAEASNDMSAARERISKAVLLFREAGSKQVLCDAMWYQASVQRKSGMVAESLKTYTELQTLAVGPRAESIRRACQSKIAELKADPSELVARKTNAQTATGPRP